MIFFSNSREYFPNGDDPYNASITYQYKYATCNYSIILKEDDVSALYSGTCDELCKLLVQHCCTNILRFAV